MCVFQFANPDFMQPISDVVDEVIQSCPIDVRRPLYKVIHKGVIVTNAHMWLLYLFVYLCKNHCEFWMSSNKLVQLSPVQGRWWVGAWSWSSSQLLPRYNTPCTSSGLKSVHRVTYIKVSSSVLQKPPAEVLRLSTSLCL